MGLEKLHRGSEAASETMGATFSGRPSAAVPRYVFSPAVTLLVADHNAYHLGQLVTIRRLLGAWHDEA